MMNICDLNELYEMMKESGYIKEDDSNGDSKPEIDPTGGGAGNCCADVNLDIPCGFQDINPVVFIIIGEVLGNILAGNLPFNVAVAVSNWLNLVGQAIETYGAQQQYFQNGPGRYYDPRYKNVSNPFCSCQEEGNESSQGNKTSQSEEGNDNNINNLNEVVESLKQEIKQYNKKIEDLECIVNKLSENYKNS